MNALLAAFLALAAPAAAAPPAPVQVAPGLVSLVAAPPDWIKGKRLGLITHPAAVTPSLEHSVDALFGSKDFRLAVLMGPEHGIRGAEWAGETVADQTDPVTGLPVYSLYGKNSKPTPAMLRDVDVLVYDVQDIGSRSYTYIATMALAMEAAAEKGIPFVVLDRPDPTGGARLEGNVPPPGFVKSLVAWLPVPYVYGMTPGEVARMANGEGWLAGGKKCDLRVIPLTGWKRGMRWSATGLPWVPTSPHIPRAESAYFYAATGVLGELGVINEGVGVPNPFELLGAPWIDGRRFAQRLNALRLPGVLFRELTYKPYYGTNKGALNHGVQIHLLDPDAAPWTALQFHALEVLRALHPDKAVFALASPAAKRTFDVVAGGPSLRERLEKGEATAAILADWEPDLARFKKARAPYLLYE
ncbi:MAG: DUF1343 domain-containing protein [Elusimicrobia bacterium]|nr:DUF1343 domain-containing protein [Elusimicrobiota bacterium]